MSHYIYKASVAKVIDGDTVDLIVDLGFHVFIKERFRLVGVSVPELNSKIPEEVLAARESREFLLGLVDGQEIVIETLKDKQAQDGKYLCRLFVSGKDVGEELVKEGYAEPYAVK